MVRFVIGTLLSAALIAQSAHALVLCAPKKGQGALSVRNACKKNQTVVDPASIGLEGLRGPEGPKGDDGQTSPVGVSGYEVVSSTQATVFVENSGGMPGLSAVVTQPCPDGTRAVGGGVDLSATDKGALRDVGAVVDRPTADGTGWEVRLFNKSVSFDTNAEVVVTVACVNVDS
ncbi:MAG TPA: hypothetical protein VGR62_07575 [Candidatus Binatia bacterium]|nr:hypothetical protein [Candidatus Binatia bacterium]